MGTRNEDEQGESYQTKKRRFDRASRRWFRVMIVLVLGGMLALVMCVADISPDRGSIGILSPGTRFFHAVIEILPDLLHAAGLSHTQVRVALVALSLLSFGSAIAIRIWLSHTDPREPDLTRPAAVQRKGDKPL
jgi:hypothetical protein